MTRMKPMFLCVLAAMTCWLSFNPGTMLAQTPGGSASSERRECPLTVESSVKMEVTNIIFMDKLQGIGGRSLTIPDDKHDQWRLGVVTIKITKPAGSRLTLAAADLTLHYYHGDKTEVAPCEGLSTFSLEDNVDRPVEFSPSMGPGFVKQTTGARATQESVIYLDAIFCFIEPDTTEIWVCVGRPITPQGFAVAPGLWK